MSNKGDAVVIGVLRSLAIFYFSIAIILATAAAVVAFLAHKPGIVHVGFALPAVEHTSVTWHAEVDAFSNRVSGAFGVRKTTANEFASWILEASRRQRIDAETLASLVLTESSFRKNVRSHVGAVGPAQVRPEYWSRFCGSSNLHDPAENI
jgi:hypothetical protein